MGKIKIKKGIQFPGTNKIGKTWRTQGRPSEWPLPQLEVGDGFETSVSNKNAVRVSIQHYQRWYQGVKFATKIIDKKILVKRIA